MARNSENAPSEPSGRRRKPPEEGGSDLRQHFRDSIRDALSGVDVDELQGRATLPVPSDVSLLTREVVTDLEVELAKLRAERAKLEGRAVEPERAARRPWRRGRDGVQAPDPEGNGVAAPVVPVRPSAVAWSVERAMEPVAEGVRDSALEGAVGPAAQGAPAPGGLAAQPVAQAPSAAASPAAPAAVTPPARAPQTAPKSRPAAAPGARPRRRAPLSDAELESVVAPLLAELANLRAEVRDLRGDPAADLPGRRASHQTVKLVAGVLIGFALIVVALAVVLKA